MLKKLLIANRGEIAVRINRTAQALGYRTVAVYSDADAKALHVEQADEAVAIGPAQVSASYLNAAVILEAARQTGADAIHPGYGFLSENADFARACEDAGLAFIGPPASAIELMGSKRRSKIAMMAAGVPVIPGFEGDNPSDDDLTAAAKDVGFPIMIKASAGGGGRGMRLVNNDAELATELTRARSEARQAFGDDELILERAVIEPRHIEIQVFADAHGNAVYLGERDCSIQRRHQKVVEEAPSPFMTPELRTAMGEAAVKAALACNYRGAGTVEFLVDKDRNFYFLEMNTRLQVEHPVTELITGQDLVAWQLSVAAGLPLPLRQDEVTLSGHAIEVRLYAEDPAQNFMPQTGNLHCFAPASGEGIRVDTGVRSGDSVSPHYDPMLAKIVAWGENRDDARRRLLRALEDTRIFGVTTNRYFLSRILADEGFGAGDATTAFLTQSFANDPSLQAPVIGPLVWALAAALFSLGETQRSSWGNSLTTRTPMNLSFNNSASSKPSELLVQHVGNEVTVEQGEHCVSLELGDVNSSELCFFDKGIRHSCQYLRQGNHLYLQVFGQSFDVTDNTHQPASAHTDTGSGRVEASMDGAIIDLMVTEGQVVQQGDTLAVLEAMKMEHPVKATCSGRIAAVHTEQGRQVQRRQLLIEIESDQTDTSKEQLENDHV